LSTPDRSGLNEIDVQPASACGGANADPNGRRVQRTRVVARRDEDRVREVPFKRRRRRDLHRQRRRTGL